MVSSKRFRMLVNELSNHCDMLIVDAPAMLVVGDTAAVANAVDAVLYVVDPRIVKRRDLEEAARQLGHLPCRKIGFVMVTEKSASTYYGYEGYAGHAHEGRRGRRRRRS
jgi:Mrp family chromosome partitioning ATPase